MSPRVSLTTKVLPSRIWTRSAATAALSAASRAGEQALKSDQESQIALGIDEATQNGRHGVGLSGRQLVAEIAVEANDGVGPALLTTDADGAPIDRDVDGFDGVEVGVDDVDAEGSRTGAQEWLRPGQ